MHEDRLKTKPDIEFTDTHFYRKWKEAYPQLNSMYVPKNVTRSIKPDRIYPIRFAKTTALYYCKILSLNSQNGVEFIKLRIFMHYGDLDHKFKILKELCESQLLASTKKLKIPIIIFAQLLLATQNQKWDNSLKINELTEIKESSIKIVSLLEYNAGMCFKKSMELNVPYRRLPGNMLTPNSKFLTFTPLSREIDYDKLIDLKFKFIGFAHCYFNFNNSLLFLRNPAHFNSVIRSITMNENYESNYHFNDLNSKSNLKKRNKPLIKSKQNMEADGMDKSNSHYNSNDNCTENSSRNILTNRKRKNSEFIEFILSKREKDDYEVSIQENWSKNDDLLAVPRRSLRKTKKINDSDNKEVISKEVITHSQSSGNSDNSANDTKKLSSSAIFKKKSKDVLRRWKNESEFLEEYHKFYQKTHNHLPRIPKMGWVEVDVFKLFKQTIQRGGYKDVTKKMLWKDIYKSLNNTTIVSNAATTMKSHYKKLLAEFEDFLYNNSSAQNNHIGIDDASKKISVDRNGRCIKSPDQDTESCCIVSPTVSKEFMIDNILNKKDHEFNESLRRLAKEHMIPESIAPPNYYHHPPPHSRGPCNMYHDCPPIQSPCSCYMYHHAMGPPLDSRFMCPYECYPNDYQSKNSTHLLPANNWDLERRFENRRPPIISSYHHPPQIMPMGPVGMSAQTSQSTPVPPIFSNRRYTPPFLHPDRNGSPYSPYFDNHPYFYEHNPSTYGRGHFPRPYKCYSPYLPEPYFHQNPSRR